MDIPIVADGKTALLALLEKAQKLDTQKWLEQIRQWKIQYPLSMKTEGLTPEKVIGAINHTFDNAIIATDMGQNRLWATQFLELSEKKQMLTSGDGGMQMNIHEMFFDRRYSSACMRYRKSCPRRCNAPTEHCPECTPDFMKLAESYGANGIRVTKENEIAAALETAKHTLKVPTVIEFIIEPEENVMPIVPSGNALDDMILESGDKGI